MSGELSYHEALYGLVDESDMEAMVGLIESHKSWGAFRAKIPTHILINLVDEVKRLREEKGGYKQLPKIDVVDIEPGELDGLDDDEQAFDESD